MYTGRLLTTQYARRRVLAPATALARSPRRCVPGRKRLAGMIGRQTRSPLSAHQPPDWLVDQFNMLEAQEAQMIANTPTQPLPRLWTEPPAPHMQRPRVTPVLPPMIPDPGSNAELHTKRPCMHCGTEEITNVSLFHDDILHPTYARLCGQCRWRWVLTVDLAIRWRSSRGERLERKSLGAALARLLLGDEAMVEVW
jgi:hypothetical protein